MCEPSDGACASISSHPSSYCCSPSMMGESATLEQSQRSVRTFKEISNFRKSSERERRSSYSNDKEVRQCPLACRTGEDAQVLFPPAVEESASFHTSTLCCASAKATNFLWNSVRINDILLADRTTRRSLSLLGILPSTKSWPCCSHVGGEH